MSKTNYKPLKEEIKTELTNKEGVSDYAFGQWVRSGVKEHEEAVNIFLKD